MSDKQKCTKIHKCTSAKSVIQITQIINPHKFWFKYCNNAEQDRLIEKLDREIEAYAVNFVKLFGGARPAINRNDVVIALHEGKWIRGIAGDKEESVNEGEYNDVYVWALDYGCELLISSDAVYPLNEPHLAYRRPLNVHVGGVSGIVPVNTVSISIAFRFPFV